MESFLGKSARTARVRVSELSIVPKCDRKRDAEMRVTSETRPFIGGARRPPREPRSVTPRAASDTAHDGKRRSAKHARRIHALFLPRRVSPRFRCAWWYSALDCEGASAALRGDLGASNDRGTCDVHFRWCWRLGETVSGFGRWRVFWKATWTCASRLFNCPKVQIGLETYRRYESETQIASLSLVGRRLGAVRGLSVGCRVRRARLALGEGRRGRNRSR